MDMRQLSIDSVVVHLTENRNTVTVCGNIQDGAQIFQM